MTPGGLWRASVVIGVIVVGDTRATQLLRMGDIVVFLDEFRGSRRSIGRVADYTLFQLNGHVVYRHETMKELVEHLRWIEAI